MTINEKFTNTDYISKKDMRRINILRHLGGTFWGSDPKTILYKGIDRSHFDYSRQYILINASSTHLTKLNVVQNIGLYFVYTLRLCGICRAISSTYSYKFSRNWDMYTLFVFEAAVVGGEILS